LAASFAIAAVVLLPVFIASGLWWTTPSGFVLILWLGLAATTVAYLLFGVGLTVLQPGHIATLNLAEPVVATMLGLLLLSETLGLRGWVGSALVVVALALLGFAGRTKSGRAQRKVQASV
jgi:DME family drug/metabolite transporter